MGSIKAVLDMDPGVDDAIALALAVASPEVEILGLTTVCGNVKVEASTRNALRVLHALGVEDVEVYPGAPRPLIKDLRTAEFIHGTDGLGDSGLPESPLKARQLRAARFIADLVLSSEPNSISVITTGPLTNLAIAYLLEPTVPELLKEHIAMCGAFGLTPYGCGNVTPVSEFNAFVDPEAAKIALSAKSRKLIVGLDVTNKPEAIMDIEFYRKLDAVKSRGTALVTKVSKKVMERDRYLNLHDPMAVAVAMYRSLVRTEDYFVDVVTVDDPVVRGQTVVDRRHVSKEPNAEVCVDVNGPLFLSFLYDRLSRI
jgi:inosine-uridine nucleoside N-ribohydrolase